MRTTVETTVKADFPFLSRKALVIDYTRILFQTECITHALFLFQMPHRFISQLAKELIHSDFQPSGVLGLRHGAVKVGRDYLVQVGRYGSRE